VGVSTPEPDVTRILRCECGVTVRGETDDELVDRAEAHIRQNHPDVAEAVTREQLLSMSEEE
jgi:predicted small metal-binding protein